MNAAPLLVSLFLLMAALTVIGTVLSFSSVLMWVIR